jgi:hypothetical protein
VQISQDPNGLNIDIFDKHSQPDHAGISMIFTLHVVPIFQLQPNLPKSSAYLK